MKKRQVIGFSAALLAAAAQPAAAAELIGDGTPIDRRTSAFAGGTFRLALGGEARKSRPEARLHLGLAHRSGPRGSALREVAVSGLSLGAGRKGKAALFVGGSEAAEVKDRLGVSTGGAIAIGAGVTLLALVAVAAAAGPPEMGCALADDPDEC